MRESYDRYSSISIALHWLTAVLLVVNFVIAFTMHDVRGLFPWHKSIGMAVLLLTLFRLGWRIAHPWPGFPQHMAAWERVLARSTHIAFYVLLLAVPLLGWATVSAGRGTGEVFGFMPWFDLPVGKSETLNESLGGAHVAAAWLVLVLVALHIAGALKHHFYHRDVVLRRMLPVTRRHR